MNGVADTPSHAYSKGVPMSSHTEPAALASAGDSRARVPQTGTDNLPAVMTVEEVARFLRIGRSAAYELVRLKVIPSVRLGRLIRVPRDSLLAWLAKEKTAEGESAGM